MAESSGFFVKNIEIQGAKSLESATILHHLDVHPGQYFDVGRSSETIQKLYASGFFEDVHLSRKGKTLIVTVVERSTLYEVKISGAKKVAKEKIENLLGVFDIVKGKQYSKPKVYQFKQALLNLYRENDLSKARVTMETVPISYHRVKLNIHIEEGDYAHIRSLHISGNQQFSERRLLWAMGLSEPHWWTYLTHSDRYSKKGLALALERLKAFYLDRGYVDFQVKVQTQLLDKEQSAEVTLKISEGNVYQIGNIVFTGKWGKALEKVKKRMTLKSGQIASNKDLILQQQQLGRLLANQGYALAHVQLMTKRRPQDKRLDIRFHGVLGSEVKVRHIHFAGNHKTAGYVLRQEMRQQEGRPFSLAAVEESKRRLANLRYLSHIEIKPVPVPGRNDQVDLYYTVKEGSSASANFQLGYSDIDGLLYGIFFKQLNFLGTGRSVSVSFDHSEYSKNYSFVYNNPYYKPNGVSRGFHLYSEHVTSNRVNISDYRSDIYGGGVHYKIPLGKYQQLGFGYGYEHTRLYAGDSASDEVKDFIEEQGHQFDQFKLRFGWYFGNYDRGVFPTRGMHHGLHTELGLPFNKNSIDYYKLSYEGTLYQPLGHEWIFAVHGQLGYGRGYGNTGSGLPFFKRFYAGGMGSVRGYEGNSLGPKDSMGRSTGGNLLTVATLNLIVPPFLGDTVRTAIFFDAGSVDIERFGALKYSVGVSIRWHTPMAPLVFSFAQALNKQNVKREIFQFTLGGAL